MMDIKAGMRKMNCEDRGDGMSIVDYSMLVSRRRQVKTNHKEA